MHARAATPSVIKTSLPLGVGGSTYSYVLRTWYVCTKYEYTLTQSDVGSCVFLEDDAAPSRSGARMLLCNLVGPRVDGNRNPPLTAKPDASYIRDSATCHIHIAYGALINASHHIANLSRGVELNPYCCVSVGRRICACVSRCTTLPLFLALVMTPPPLTTTNDSCPGKAPSVRAVLLPAAGCVARLYTCSATGRRVTCAVAG